MVSALKEIFQEAVKNKDKKVIDVFLNLIGFSLEIKIGEEFVYVPCCCIDGVISVKYPKEIKGCDYEDNSHVTSRYVISNGEELIIPDWFESDLHNKDLGYINKKSVWEIK